MGERLLKNFLYMVRLRPEVKPLALSYTIFDGNVHLPNIVDGQEPMMGSSDEQWHPALPPPLWHTYRRVTTSLFLILHFNLSVPFVCSRSWIPYPYWTKHITGYKNRTTGIISRILIGWSAMVFELIYHWPYIRCTRLFRNNYSRFWGISLGVFNKTIIPLSLVGYKIVIANSYPTRLVGYLYLPDGLIHQENGSVSWRLRAHQKYPYMGICDACTIVNSPYMGIFGARAVVWRSRSLAKSRYLVE